MARIPTCIPFVAGLACLLAACGGGGGGASTAPTPPEVSLQTLLPLDAGNRWVYAREPVGNADIVVEAVGPDTANGSSGVVVRTLHYDGLDQQAVASVETTLMVASATAIRQVPLAGTDPLSTAIGAIDLLRGPISVGDRFEQFDEVITTLDLDGDGVPDPTRITASVEILAREAVSVPAGQFDDALKVRTVLVQSATASSTGRALRIEGTDDTWFAPGVGIVRNRIDIRVDGQPYSSVQRSLKAYGLADRRTESVPPQVMSVEPAGSGPARVTPRYIEIRVDERVDVFSLPDRLLLRDAQGQTIPGQVRQIVDPAGDGYRLYFEPVVSPLPSGEYTLTLSADTIDMVGNRLGADVVARYTIDSDAPRLASSVPGANATGVSIDASIELRFDEAIRYLGGDGALGVVLGRQGTDETLGASITIGEDTIRIDPSLALERGTTYELTLETWTLADRPGNAAAQPVRLSFTTDPGWYGHPEPAFTESFDTVLADIDGDGRLDIAAWTNSLSGSTGALELVTRRQMPDGSLSAPVRSGILLERPCHIVRSMAAGDMNADGRIDLVVSDGCNVSVVLQRADGTLEAVRRTVVPGRYDDMRVADMDGDGRDDIVLHALNLPTSLGIHLWRQISDGSFSQQEIDVTAGNTPQLQAFDLADVDGNGLLDLVIVATDGDPFVYRYSVVLQDTGGRFGTVLSRLADAGPYLGVADIDGDGRADIFGAGGGDSTGRLEWVRLGTNGSLEKVTLIPVSDTPQSIAFADADGDGRIDVLVAHSGGGGLGVLRQSASGALEVEQIYDEGNANLGTDLATGDLNGDGRTDVLFGNFWLPSLGERP
jgi:hypothetical protein